MKSDVIATPPKYSASKTPCSSVPINRAVEASPPEDSSVPPDGPVLRSAVTTRVETSLSKALVKAPIAERVEFPKSVASTKSSN